MKLANKIALVTGGARGLGRAYVLHLAKLGADVVINDVDLNAAEEYDEALNAESVAAEVEALGRRALGIQADVTDKAAVEAMMQQTVDAFGQIDILVTNAGGMLHPPPNHTAATAPPDHYRYILDINLTGTIFCCQAAAPYMQAARSGQNRHRGIPGRPLERPQQRRHGLQSRQSRRDPLHPRLAAELGPAQHPCQLYRARICALLPRRRRRAATAPKSATACLQDIPLGRLGMPEDCAKVVEFLVTDLSDYVTGQCIPVCGGYVAF